MSQLQALRSAFTHRKGGAGPGRLTPEQREQMIAEFVESPGLSYNKLAKKYGVVPRTVKYHVMRELQHLEKELGEPGSGQEAGNAGPSGDAE